MAGLHETEIGESLAGSRRSAHEEILVTSRKRFGQKIDCFPLAALFDARFHDAPGWTKRPDESRMIGESLQTLAIFRLP